MKSLPLEKAFLIQPLFTDPTDSCTASCFEGTMGQAFADDPFAPTIAAVTLGEYIYIEGAANNTFLTEAFDYAVQHRLTIVTLNHEISRYFKTQYRDHLVVKTRYHMYTVPEPDVSALLGYIRSVPPQYELRKIDSSIYHQLLQCDWSKYFVANFKNDIDFSNNAFGCVAMYKGKPVSGTSCYSYYRSGCETVVATASEHRRKGLALACSSVFVTECLRRGKIPHWDCANERSLALAQKLGYRLYETYEGLCVSS